MAPPASTFCPHDTVSAVMRVVLLRRLPVIRVFIAFSVIITLYLYIKVMDITSTKYNATGKPAKTDEVPHGLQDGYRLEVLYSSSLNHDIMVNVYREPLEVVDPRQWSEDRLPKCDSKLLKHSDDIIVDTLKQCGDRKNFVYEPELEAWLYKTSVMCAGKFVAYGKQVALLKEAVIDRSKCDSAHNGGERLEDVVLGTEATNQQAEEFCKFKAGFFQLACPATFHYQFKGGKDSYLAQYMKSLQVFNDTIYVDDFEQTPTIALTRYEYSNIYHTVAELYNTFLGTLFLHTIPKETNIILVDAHPRDMMDNIWKRLFNTGRRINELPKRTLYKRLLWTIPGHASFLLNYNGDPPPYLNEFIEFITKGYAIRPRPQPRDCRKLRIVLIWRQDYVASVANPAGEIDRKIGNEAELLSVLRRRFPLFIVEGCHLESLHIKTQLHKMARTDLLIGMHGAGLTHALFLPSSSGVLELLPMYWTKANGHFAGIARWRGLKYERWVNTDAVAEDKEKRITKIPAGAFIKMVEKIVSRMCHES